MATWTIACQKCKTDDGALAKDKMTEYLGHWAGQTWVPGKPVPACPQCHGPRHLMSRDLLGDVFPAGGRR